ncbi:hypothetical protein PQQ73_23040 [Paraburkholderia strydomiana]|jgi:hypothetical protein|uniref:Uncharacterized protein n=1 Tax=Paraburkholderia strydomiana TaxID=1245417 RepID=A0ABW9EJF1_9BURK
MLEKHQGNVPGVTETACAPALADRASRVADNKKLPAVAPITRTERMWGGRTQKAGRTLRNQQRAETSSGRVLG